MMYSFYVFAFCATRSREDEKWASLTGFNEGARKQLSSVTKFLNSKMDSFKAAGHQKFHCLMEYINENMNRRYEVYLSQDTVNPISFSEPSDDEQVREWMNEICSILEGCLRERNHRVKSEMQLLTFATFPSCENDEECRFLFVFILISMIIGNRKDKITESSLSTKMFVPGLNT